MEVDFGRKFIGRFAIGEDLLGTLTQFCEEKAIKLGEFAIIGAVKHAKMGYYLQNEQKYIDCVDLKKTLEITACLGNISLMNGKIFVHAHITLADHDGKCYGGHLMPGTEIFAAEYHIKELLGVELKRERDPETGLFLWKNKG
ncbi:MAG: DNA-binding protein [Candidatus Omnitrophica bacterium]|nr:DNA-binding protein [Candidatus Omnitrophota bacterium]